MPRLGAVIRDTAITGTIMSRPITHRHLLQISPPTTIRAPVESGEPNAVFRIFSIPGPAAAAESGMVSAIAA